MTLIVGVDPSSKKIAIVATHILTNTVAAWSLTISKPTQKMDPGACARAQDRMDDFVLAVARMSPYDRHAWVETPLVGRSGGVRATIVQAYVGGIIRASLVNAGFVVHDVHVGTWKKEVCNNGNAKKPDVARVVKTGWSKAWTLVEHDGDLIDAAAICQYGVRTYPSLPSS